MNASAGKVLLAATVDVVILAVAAGLGFVLGGADGVALLVVLVVVVLLAQFGCLLWRGWSAGWRLLGVRLVDQRTGSAPGFAFTGWAVMDVRRGPDPIDPFLAPSTTAFSAQTAPAPIPVPVMPAPAPAPQVSPPPNLGMPPGWEPAPEATVMQQRSPAVPVRAAVPASPPPAASAPAVVQSAVPAQTGPSRVAAAPAPAAAAAPASAPAARPVSLPAAPVPVLRVGATMLVIEGVRRLPLAGRMLVGRNPVAGVGETAVAVPDLGRVLSKAHLRLEQDADGGVFVTDLGSTNGTQLQGRWLPANTRVAVGVGMVVSAGSYRLRVEPRMRVESARTEQDVVV